MSVAPRTRALAIPIFLRAAFLAALMPAQILALDSAFNAGQSAASDLWIDIAQTAKIAAYAALYGAAVLAIALWPKREAILADWMSGARTHGWLTPLALNLFACAGLIGAALLMKGAGGQASWSALLLWLAGAVAMFAAWAVALAPARFWIAFIVQHRWLLMFAPFIGAAVFIASYLSPLAWHALSGVTLGLSYEMLRLIEPTAFVEFETRLIGAGDFRVEIFGPCSGYEGVGLVLAALTAYIAVFHRAFRFPNVLLLLPIGALAIWTLNSVRIAILVLIGAHVSPEAAMEGFHSHAGWIMFCVVAIAMMLIARCTTFFRIDAPQRTADPAIALAAAMLAPFAALMASRIVAAIAGEEAYWIGAAASLIPAAAILFYGAALRPLFGRMHWESVAVGLIVGALWIMTEPPAQNAALGAWLAAQPPAETAAWLALRILGFALIVPIAEELIFRGYLHRALIGRRFEAVPPAAFTWLAFLATSLLFGAMHGRWLAGALAGAAFALCLYRSKSLTGPVLAHIAANGLIAAYALTTEEWALL